jgi:hypothetical protein
VRYGKPPRDVAPEKLFRLMLELRPSAPVKFKFRDLSQYDLVATALPAVAVAEAHGADVDATVAGLMARSLSTADGLLVFSDPDDVSDMTHEEYGALSRAFVESFSGICPSGWLLDRASWMDALTTGAKHHSNGSAVMLLGSAYEAVNVGKHIRLVGRPERYWGVAPRELTEGNLMCHAVARRLHEAAYAD